MAQSAGTFTATGNMTRGRTGHTATLLVGGRVLIAGGVYDGTAELYDPATGTFTATGYMTTRRQQHTATLLPNGKVLIAGGETCSGSGCRPLASAELYDPSAGSFTATGDMTTLRQQHTATLLPNGKVLIAGGETCDSSGCRSLASAELYDPSAGSFTATGNMTTFRAGHTASLLPDGKVLITGSQVWDGDGHLLAGGWAAAWITELYDPDAGAFRGLGGTIPPDQFGQPRTTATLTLLTNGTVLAMTEEVVEEDSPSGGAAVYDPATGAFTAIGETSVYVYTATLLPDGTVLVTGYGGPTAALYNPATGAFSTTGEMFTPRVGHTATLLPDGTVLMSGGYWSDGFASAELYHPAAVQVTPTVRIVDNNTGSRTTLAVGDSFSFQVAGAPPLSLVSVSEPGWSGSVGYTDASGLFWLNGIVGSNVVGTWQQTWTIGGVLAQPSPLQFTITPKP
jgi:WD40 repeat protein